MSLHPLLQLSDSRFFDIVNQAFQNYHNPLKLAHSRLADMTLIEPALILPTLSPDDTIQALRTVMHWAVSRLAPNPPNYPLWVKRPLDIEEDPTWNQPHWWPYNILRHRYLDAVNHHAQYLSKEEDPQKAEADEAVMSQKQSTEFLREFMEIKTRDKYFDLRRDAIREVAMYIRRQVADRQWDDELRQAAVEGRCQPLRATTEGDRMLGIVSTFRAPFSRNLVLDIARYEGLARADQLLEGLIRHRLVAIGDKDGNLILAPAVQAYMHARQTDNDLRRRHRMAARFYRERGIDPLTIAWHLHLSGSAPQAADVLLTAARPPVRTEHLHPLCLALQGFTAQELDQDHWREIQICLSDLLRQLGRHDESIKSCKEALAVRSNQAIDQARIYRRLGKLHESQHPKRALDYYQRAAERFPTDHPERLEMLKDRSHWLQQGERWVEAEADLLLVIKETPEFSRAHADAFDALGTCYNFQGRYDEGLYFAKRGLVLREEMGDAQKVADSWNNIGMIFANMGNYDDALRAYGELRKASQEAGDQTAKATYHNNVGSVYYRAGQIQEAINEYNQAMAIFQEQEDTRHEIITHYNLAEAFATLGQVDEAHGHWQSGYVLSEQFEILDQASKLKALRDQWPVLQTAGLPTPSYPQHSYQHETLPNADQTVLRLASQHGRVTAAMVVNELKISIASAKRLLKKLSDQGFLLKTGQARATCYILTPLSPIPTPNSNGRPKPIGGTHAAMDNDNPALVTELLATFQKVLRILSAHEDQLSPEDKAIYKEAQRLLTKTRPGKRDGTGSKPV